MTPEEKEHTQLLLRCYQVNYKEIKRAILQADCGTGSYINTDSINQFNYAFKRIQELTQELEDANGEN